MRISKCCSAVNSEPSNLNLCHVQVVFRHGARTPFHVHALEQVAYPPPCTAVLPETTVPMKLIDLDSGKRMRVPEVQPTDRPLLGGAGRGVLTVTGQNQALALGRTVMALYAAPLGLAASWEHGEIACRTSMIPRTVRTLSCMLTGMYGKEELERAGPITVWSKVPEAEDMYPNPHNETINSIFRIMESELVNVQTKDRNYRRVLAEVNDPSDVNLYVLWDDISCRMAEGHPFPDKMKKWTRDITRHAATHIHVMTTGHLGDNPDVTWITMGTFVEGLLVEMERAVVAAGGAAASGVGSTRGVGSHVDKSAPKNLLPGPGGGASGRGAVGVSSLTSIVPHMSKPPKMVLYSAHDTTLAPILHAIGAWQHKWPDFCSWVALELHKSVNGDFFVRIRHSGKLVKSQHFGTTTVPLQTFQRRLLRHTPPRHRREHSMHESTSRGESSKLWQEFIPQGESEHPSQTATDRTTCTEFTPSSGSNRISSDIY